MANEGTATLSDPEYRRHVKWISNANMVLGVWLFLSAFLVANTSSMLWNNMILGVLVAVLAGLRGHRFSSQTWMSWVMVVLGAWIAFSPWAFLGAPAERDMSVSVPASLIANNVSVGVLLFLLGIWNAFMTLAGKHDLRSLRYPS